jgi:Spy/CpxP family protein refolding chaperone/polyhydroxyalkanoate synthesis regulator phasin
MKNKLVVVIFLFVGIAPVALSARDNANDKNAQRTDTQLTVSTVEHPAFTTQLTDPAVTPREPEPTPQDYESAMVAVTQMFSAKLAAIAEAVQRGELSSEQGKEMSAELYQVAQMQFELLSLWREIEEEDVARIPDVQASPAPTQENEIVMVALPFSSFQLNPSLSDYLSLTPSQVETIRQVMAHERQSLQPLMTQLRITREKLLAVGGNHMNEKQVKDVAQAEAALLARLIVANARMQAKIYKVLSPDQQKKLSNLERTQGSAIEEGQ